MISGALSSRWSVYALLDYMLLGVAVYVAFLYCWLYWFLANVPFSLNEWWTWSGLEFAVTASGFGGENQGWSVLWTVVSRNLWDNVLDQWTRRKTQLRLKYNISSLYCSIYCRLFSSKIRHAFSGLKLAFSRITILVAKLNYYNRNTLLQLPMHCKIYS